MNYNFLLITIAILGIIGCAEIPKPITSKNPYVKFSVTHDASTNNSTGTVFLWGSSEAGKALVIDKDEQLFYQDKAMQYLPSNKSYYLSLNGYSVLNKFKLVDLEKKEFINTIWMSNISFPTDIQDNLDTINVSLPLNLKWIGNPVDTNEIVKLTIDGKVFSQDTLAETSIDIPESDLMSFKGRYIQVDLDRYKERPLQEKPGSDGLISYYFKSKPRKIYFKDGPAPLSNKKIYTEFSIIYDATTNVSTGVAQLWDGSKSGAAIFIDATASLKFQNSSMQLETGTNRYSSFYNSFTLQNEFRYVDINKKEFLNVIALNKISLPSNLLDTVNTSLPLKISWTEAAVGSSEIVTLRISNKNFIQDTLNLRNISIPSAELAFWKGTSQKVYIERFKLTTLQQMIGADGLGSISSRYISQAKTIYFK